MQMGPRECMYIYPGILTSGTALTLPENPFPSGVTNATMPPLSSKLTSSNPIVSIHTISVTAVSTI